MGFDEVATTRRSVQQYGDEAVSEKGVREVFEAVRHAPSPYDLQPWEFLVVRGDDLERLQAVAYGQEHVTDAAAAVVVLGNLDPSAHVDRVVADQVEKGYLPNEDAADAVRETVESMAESGDERRRNWTTSTALAAMSLMHAAWARGVASCPTGGFDADALRDAFGVPEGDEPVMLVTLGPPRRTPRTSSARGSSAGRSRSSSTSTSSSHGPTTRCRRTTRRCSPAGRR